MSHPVRVRGLKLEGTWVAKYKDTVAPRAGAWVETEMYCLNLRRRCCTRAGAWVETDEKLRLLREIERTLCGCVG